MDSTVRPRARATWTLTNPTDLPQGTRRTNEWNTADSEARRTRAPTTTERSKISRHLSTQERRWIQAKIRMIGVRP